MKEVVKRTLILVFGSSAGDVKVTINKPKDNLTRQDIINGMDGMIHAKALGEEYLVNCRAEAKFVIQAAESLDLNEA